MKKIYLMMVTLLDKLFLFIKPKYQVTYFMSFSDNQNLIDKLINKFSVANILIVYRPYLNKEIKQIVKNNPKLNAQKLCLFDAFHFVLNIKQSRVVLFDNYFPELSAIKKQVYNYFFQIWHANGAIKAFGWDDPTTYRRSEADQIRFQKVYDSFDQIVVGSEAMAEVFKQSWHVKSSQIDKIGYWRSDKFFQERKNIENKKKILKKFSYLNGKKIILYAPTYRKNVTFKFPINWNQLNIPEGYIMIIRLHPHLREKEQDMVITHPNVITLPSAVSTSNLLCISDVLITDYSSVAFDFSLLSSAKKLVLFTFDLEQYDKTVGLQSIFIKKFKNYFVNNITELNKRLLSNDCVAEKELINNLNDEWNTFNDGHATDRLINQIEKVLYENNN